MPFDVQLPQGWLMRDVGKAVERRKVWSASRCETFSDEAGELREKPGTAPRHQGDGKEVTSVS